jgi:hypothetical protein
MNKKPIIVYWAPYVDSHPQPDWSFLYPKPISLFNDYLKDKRKESKNHFFMCPASALKMKKTLVFNSPTTFGYDFDFSNGKENLNGKYENNLLMYTERDPMLTIGPNFKIGLGYSFFASESLEASFTSPFFHKAKYMESCATIPGNFNIGEWYRPYSFEIQTWSDKGTIDFIEGEPLFYVEFKTDRPIILKRYKQTELLTNYSHACMSTKSIFGLGESLKSKYQRFRSVGLREKVLSEIEKNVFDEEFIQL